MKFKYLITTLALAIISQLAFAQKSELSSAKSKYQKYIDLKQFNATGLGSTDLKDAKTSIDKAIAHDKTSGDPVTWAYKGLIYTELAIIDSLDERASLLIDQAVSALKQSSDLDKNGTNKTLIDQGNDMVYRYQFNKGVKDYQASRYDAAYTAFNRALIYKPADTTLNYYTGLSAINAKNYKAAIQNYGQLLKTNYSSNRQIYLDLSRLYVMEKDTLSGIRIASEGARKYPNDVALATQEIELNLMSGKQKEVISKIIDQEQKNPGNKLYPFYLGIAYSATNDYVKAEEAYKRAIEIEPTYASAYLNLAGILINRGIDTYNAANKLPVNKQKEYEETLKKAHAQFDIAYPYLQKAVDLDPSSRLALENLKKYYFIKKDKVKEDEIAKRLNQLK